MRYSLEQCQETFTSRVLRTVRGDPNLISNLIIALDVSASMNHDLIPDQKTRLEAMVESLKALLTDSALVSMKNQLKLTLIVFGGDEGIRTVINQKLLSEIDVDNLGLPPMGRGMTPIGSAIDHVLTLAEQMKAESRAACQPINVPIAVVFTDGTLEGTDPDRMAAAKQHLARMVENARSPKVVFLAYGLGDENFSYLTELLATAKTLEGAGDNVIRTPEDLVRSLRFIKATTIATVGCPASASLPATVSRSSLFTP